MLDWKPNHGHGRSRGRPKTRWTDSLDSFAGGDWKHVAQDEKQWDTYEDAFVRNDLPSTFSMP